MSVPKIFKFRIKSGTKVNDTVEIARCYHDAIAYGLIHCLDIGSIQHKGFTDEGTGNVTILITPSNLEDCQDILTMFAGWQASFEDFAITSIRT